SVAAKSGSSERPAAGTARPPYRFQVTRRTRTLSRLPRHFLTGSELAPGELTGLIERALELKAAPDASRALEGRHVALLFERPSTRTRVSFANGIVEMGGHPVVLLADELQLSRG